MQKSIHAHPVHQQQPVNCGSLANFDLVQSDNLLSDRMILTHSEFALL